MTSLPHSQPERESDLLAKIARLEQTIDTLENNARVQAKLLADTARSGVQSAEVSFPRWWIEKIRDDLMNTKLPSGPLGDWAFLFREQLNDKLAASSLSSAESAIGFEEALDDFIKRYPQTLSYLAGRP